MIVSFSDPQGINFRSDDELPASTLSKVLGQIAGFIQDIEPHGVKLRRYDDWWEHDGLHFDRGTIDIHSLFELVHSPRDLIQAMPGDDEVFVGVAPENGSWYLRFYLAWDEEGHGLVGRFDITLPPQITEQFKGEIVSTLDAKVLEQDAVSYYQSIKA